MRSDKASKAARTTDVAAPFSQCMLGTMLHVHTATGRDYYAMSSLTCRCSLTPLILHGIDATNASGLTCILHGIAPFECNSMWYDWHGAATYGWLMR